MMSFGRLSATSLQGLLLSEIEDEDDDKKDHDRSIEKKEKASNEVDEEEDKEEEEDAQRYLGPLKLFPASQKNDEE